MQSSKTSERDKRAFLGEQKKMAEKMGRSPAFPQIHQKTHQDIEKRLQSNLCDNRRPQASSGIG